MPLLQIPRIWIGSLLCHSKAGDADAVHALENKAQKQESIEVGLMNSEYAIERALS